MDPADVIPTDQALRVYPVLAGLLAIIGAGWRFTETRDEGGTTALTGVRGYSHMPNVIDAIKIVDEHGAVGFRVLHPDRMMWVREGGLADVVDGLLNLPDPASPLAPHLVLGATPQTLWTPNHG